MINISIDRQVDQIDQQIENEQNKQRTIESKGDETKNEKGGVDSISHYHTIALPSDRQIENEQNNSKITDQSDKRTCLNLAASPIT